MLTIGTVKVLAINQGILLDEFGENYTRCPQLDDDVAAMIEDEEDYSFPDMQTFKQAVARGRNSGGHLRLDRRFIMRSRPGPYSIEMTGSRSGDAVAANAKAKLVRTPDTYTWHHAENITFNQNKKVYLCNMYLIKTWYHRRKHTGGVHEYELFTNTVYN